MDHIILFFEKCYMDVPLLLYLSLPYFHLNIVRAVLRIHDGYPNFFHLGILVY